MVRGEIRLVSFSLRALIFTTDNIVKQDFMSVRLFDNCYGCLDHTKYKKKKESQTASRPGVHISVRAALNLISVHI